MQLTQSLSLKAETNRRDWTLPPGAAWVVDDDGKTWDSVLTNARSVPPGYLRSLMRYQQAYLLERTRSYVDLSMVFFSDGRPAAAWPMAAFQNESGWQLASQEAPIRPPLFAKWVAEKTEKRIVDHCHAWLQGAARRLDLVMLRAAEPLRESRLTPWHLQLMESGARLTATHLAAVDLCADLEQLRLNFRKSYRPLISRGLKLWNVHILTEPNERIFAKFRDLHRAVAGRATRGDMTWQVQHEAIAAGEAFLVALSAADGRLVGGGLFHHSTTEAVYAVGVYDRSLFELPLGHVVQFKAIEYMKSRGLHWYWLGSRPYPADNPTPTAKEIQIGLFKQGFATHLVPQLEISLDCARPPPGGDE